MEGPNIARDLDEAAADCSYFFKTLAEELLKTTHVILADDKSITDDTTVNSSYDDSTVHTDVKEEPLARSRIKAWQKFRSTEKHKSKLARQQDDQEEVDRSTSLNQPTSPKTNFDIIENSVKYY
jgi:hypothetical protein